MPNGINLFFSNDQNEKRSELFVKANHPQGDFSVGADPTSDDLQSIMLASNMINFDETRQNKNDIAAEFTDFIINTALHHRNLDNPRQADVGSADDPQGIRTTLDSVSTRCNNF